MKISERREKRGEKIREAIANANTSKSIVLVITGNGKGKSTAGFGTLFRALGHGQKVAAVQFLKGTGECGERELLNQLKVPVYTMDTGCSWLTKDEEQERLGALKVWQQAKTLLSDPSLDLLLLDELTYLIAWGYIDAEEIVAAIENRPKQMSVVITGRGAHRRLKQLADTVSEVRPVKHAFTQGVMARKGVDY